MNKKKTVKKIIIIILIFAVVIAGVIFALSMLKKKNQNKREVLVVPVSSMSSNPNEWGMGDTSYSGYVSASMNQKVYINASTKIEEVYVSEGQTVKAGDTILKYDVTAQQLQLESKKAQVALANNRVTSLERDLKRLNETVPIEDMPKPEPVVPPAAPEDNLATDTDASSEQPVQEPEQQPSDTSGVDDTDMGMTYTREELNQAIKDKENEIRDAKVSAALEEISYEIMLNQNQSPELYSNFDGVVTKVEDEETAISENKPYITISNSEGLTVVTYIGEYSLSDIQIGDSYDMYCYDTGMSYTGTVSDVGNMPAEDYNSWGAAQSYYPVELSVMDAADLSQGMYLEVTKAIDYSTYDDMEDQSTSSGFVIPIQFVRKEDGKRYVMKEENGKLVKAYVKTGKIYWGSEIEILGGLSQSDYVAFPYVADAVEGVKTRQGSLEELYGY